MKIITQANTVTTATGSLNRVHTDYENNRSIIQIGASTTIHINTEEATWLIAALQDSNNRLLDQTSRKVTRYHIVSITYPGTELLYTSPHGIHREDLDALQNVLIVCIDTCDNVVISDSYLGSSDRNKDYHDILNTYLELAKLSDGTYSYIPVITKHAS